ncbi:hypothetical protein QTP86_034328 [Hemibagrus guttatus]|nr:hypothetical protein QTP86_034328 [Hemibagrus guttatus]
MTVSQDVYGVKVILYRAEAGFTALKHDCPIVVDIYSQKGAVTALLLYDNLPAITYSSLFMVSVVGTESPVPRLSVVSVGQEICDAWTPFKHGSHGPAVSLYWLLEEPLVGGGRMDIKDSSPGLTHITQSKKFTTLKRLVDMAGREFKDTRAVAEELSLRSLRYTEDIIQRWTNKLSEDELNLIKEYHDGTETPDGGDPFPELELLPELIGYEGMYLDAEKGHVLPIYEAKGKDIYKCCVKVINKRKRDRRVDTVWRQGLGVLDDIKPVWRVFYKTLVGKRADVLQWRILHGAVGVSVLISKLNPDVSQMCPFCNGTETVFHCDSGCKRLNPLLELLKTFFNLFGEKWTRVRFIFGAGHRRAKTQKWEPINFIVGEAEMSVYITRKHQVERRRVVSPTSVSRALVKSGVKVDFNFFK